MMDANFRLKMKDRGATDVALGPGWAYCVETDRFKAHVREFGDHPAEVSTSSLEYIMSHLPVSLDKYLQRRAKRDRERQQWASRLHSDGARHGDVRSSRLCSPQSRGRSTEGRKVRIAHMLYDES